MVKSMLRSGWRVSLAMALCAGGVSAQASYLEGFDDNGATPAGQYGPTNLIAKGWTFRMQSSPASTSVYFDGYEGQTYPAPHLGTGYLGADAFMSSSSGPVSQWALLPVIPNQAAGDLVKLHVRRLGGLPAKLQVRYSPSGGTGTGSGPTGLGDFTTVLIDIDPIPEGAWLAYTATVPGAGRLALRFHGRFEAFSFGMYSGIDTLSVGAPPPPPCNQPPIPSPGQTISWTLAGSPYRVCTDLLVPAGGGVTVEPGVTVNVDDGKSLVIDGEVTAHGTVSLPITWNGSNSVIHAPFYVPDGKVDLAHGVVTGTLRGGSGTNLLIADSTFSGQGNLRSTGTTGQTGDLRYSYVQVDRCTFGPGGVNVEDGTLVVRDSSFFGGSMGVTRGSLWTSNVSLDGGVVGWSRDWPGQPGLIDTVSIRNNPSLPALLLDSGNYFLGSGNVLQNNLYPVQIKAGLLPGSTLPVAGNTNNHIRSINDSQTPRGGLIWGNLAIPYVVEGNPLNGTAGSLRIEPGTTVHFMPDAGWSFLGGQRLFAEGLPEAPITFDAFTPGQDWRGISFNSNATLPRLESCIVRGSRAGIVASDAPNVWIQDCLFEDNRLGASASVFGWLRVRKSRFFGNDIATKTDQYPVSHGIVDLFGGTNGNWFQGNGLALQVNNASSTIQAQQNYWGHPTGPRHPENPGGLGDEIETGGSDVKIFPFRTAPPDFSDHPPRVKMKDPYFVQRRGEKLILEWEAEDDHGIVAQKLFFTNPGSGPETPDMVLPPTQRRLELTVDKAYIRILAVDTAGQEGFDDVSFGVPYTEDWTGSLTLTTDFSAGLRPGQRIDVCYTKSTGLSGTITGALVLDGDRASIPLGGGHTGIDCVPGGLPVPYVSTDTARIALLFTYGAAGRVEYFFSPPFRIRPDPRVGDLPPEVTLTSPAPGSSYAGGTIVPIAWDATDDQGVRSISIQASYDGGRTWSFLARDLPGGSTAYGWHLPTSSGIPNVRLRVIAADLRFQNTSDTVPIAILPGADKSCYADCDADGDLDRSDLACFTALYEAGDPAADCDLSGVVDSRDPTCFKKAYSRGCLTKPIFKVAAPR